MTIVTQPFLLINYPTDAFDSTVEKRIELARELLVACSCDEEFYHLLVFITEQLDLCVKSKGGRRYSTESIIRSYLWYIYSPTLYRQLRQFFILPSPNRLKQLSSACLSSATVIDHHYLTVRTKNLSERDKNVNLSIDEIYTAKRVEYSSGTGSLIGLAEDNEPAKTVLAFMVKSLSSHYQDVVKLIPLNCLTAEKLLEYFKCILKALTTHLSVVSVSVDNHSVNR